MPIVGILALGQAESGWRRDASRRGVWPDWSDGYGQITVALAAAYGIGNGTEASGGIVNATMLNRGFAIDIMCAYLAQCLTRARTADPALQGDALLLAAMVVYNSGSYQEPGNWWYQRWSANIASYRRALAWAHAVLEA